MSETKNGGSFEQQQFGTAGVERVKNINTFLWKQKTYKNTDKILLTNINYSLTIRYIIQQKAQLNVIL